MNYMSVKQAAEKWNMTPRRVQVLCNENRIEGAQRVGNVWTIPENAQKPDDARKKVMSKKKVVNANVTIERVWAMPNKNTFEIKPISELLEDELTDDLWIDPFANKNKYATITNDLNPAYDTDYHMDALDFLKQFDDESVDGVLYDPPFSPRQVSECYNDVGYNVTWDTTKASFWGNHKREISRIVKKGGKVITFGWNSGGIGYKYGFEIKRILLVPHGGWHNDTICTVEIKTHDGEYTKVKEIPILNAPAKNETATNTDELLIQKLSSLPADFWDFKEDDTREYTHGIHSYPAMMVCPISRNIIKMVQDVMPVKSIFDPFAGSGTVLVEGMLAGIETVVGNDINPLALYLSRAKTKNLDISELQREIHELVGRIQNRYLANKYAYDNADHYIHEELRYDLTAKDGWGSDAPAILQKYCDDVKLDLSIPSFKNIGYWFKPRAILFLQMIKDNINQIQNVDIRNFIFVAFSESIRLVSNRRNGEFKMFRMPPAKVEKFTPDVIGEFRKILLRNAQKMNSFNEACADRDIHTDVTIYQNNATVLSDIPDDRFDLVITSPPYGDSRTTVAYGEYSRLSLQWLDVSDMTEKEIMGIDRSLMGGKKYHNGFEYLLNSEILKEALLKIKDVDIERAGDVYSFYDDLDQSISAIAQKTKSNGYQFWVVGNRTVKGVLLPTDEIIAELAQKHGMEYLTTVHRNIVNKVMPSANSPTNEVGKTATTMNTENIVVLRKK